MHKRIICGALILLLSTLTGFCETKPSEAGLFGAEDLHLNGKTMTSFQLSNAEQVLVFEDGFDLIVGDNKFKSNKAVIWLSTITTEHLGVQRSEYKLTVYFQDKVTVKQGAGAKLSDVEVEKPVVENAEALVAKFTVTGQIYATSDRQSTEDPRASELYHNAQLATGQIKPEPQKEETTEAISDSNTISETTTTDANDEQESPKQGIINKVFGSKDANDTKTTKAAKVGKAAKKTRKHIKKKTAAVPTVKKAVVPPPPPIKISYPINISSATERPLKTSIENLPDNTGIAVVLDRFYLWQKQDENGRTLEFMADNAVIFYAGKHNSSEPNQPDKLPADNAIRAIYFRGDVIMTEGNRTIRAAEAYYDFQKKQALMIKPVMQTYDTARGIPVYVRAEKIRQVAENKFSAENATITSSEFYVPQISATASKVYITDTTNVDMVNGKTNKHSYDAVMEKVKLKVNDKTVFYWPKIRSNLESSDMPLRKLKIGKDSTFGTSIESEWYLTKVMGVREPNGVDSRLMLDTYSKRGTGAGADISYKRENYFGNINGYVINDRGEDDLGRSRKDIEPDQTMRGMFNFQHRQFLPEHWQVTLETSYLSDENFLEAFRRQDYFEDRERETSIHLKWIKDNQAFAVLGRWRINDFADQMEDLPSAQYHLKGQSLWNDKLTLYSDSQLGRQRQLTGDNHDLNIKDEYFTFGSHRTEIDFPMQYKTGNIVPFVAGTFGYDDRGGFSRDIATGEGTEAGDPQVFIGQAGVRASTQYWKHYNVQSKFWDINGLRHIVKPYINASVFAESSKYVEQKDVVSLGVLQRWQTKRGRGDKQRLLDWMRLNLEYTKVSDPSSVRRADNTIWNSPFVPLSTLVSPGIYNSDLKSKYRTFELYGPQRDNVTGDYIWRLSDTTAILSDFYYDVQDSAFEQFDIGLSRLVWPNLSLYVGSRYMRSIEIDNEKGSHAVTFAAAYKLSPRYTLSFSHQYDFDRDGLIATEISLVRRYHRLYYALTYGVDESLDRRTIVLTIWPEGVGEMSMGSSKSLLGLENPAERND